MPLSQKNLSPLGITAKKQLGQNFLQGACIPSQIVEKSGVTKTDIVLEIGPGLGALTFPLAKIAQKVIAIEKDPDVAAILEEKLRKEKIQNTNLLVGDILQTDFADIANEEKTQLFVFGNLPYHISSPVLGLLTKNASHLKKAVLMFQKELADRIIASPGKKTYSRISVLCQFYGRVESLLFVDATHFYPRPKVNSEVISISFYNPNPHLRTNETLFFKIVQAAFGQRRKNLKNAFLGSSLNFSLPEITNVFQLAKIDSSRRAETLSIDEFISLTDAFQKLSFTAFK